jgi:hypothetical protein
LVREPSRALVAQVELLGATLMSTGSTPGTHRSTRSVRAPPRGRRNRPVVAVPHLGERSESVVALPVQKHTIAGMRSPAASTPRRPSPRSAGPRAAGTRFDRRLRPSSGAPRWSICAWTSHLEADSIHRGRSRLVAPLRTCPGWAARNDPGSAPRRTCYDAVIGVG